MLQFGHVFRWPVGRLVGGQGLPTGRSLRSVVGAWGSWATTAVPSRRLETLGWRGVHPAGGAPFLSAEPTGVVEGLVARAGVTRGFTGGTGRRALLPAGGVLAVEAPRDAVGGRTSRRVIWSRARSSCPPMIFDVTPSG
jgi:hypothetical protein